MKDLVKKKDKKNSWFKNLVIINTIMGLLCLIIFLSLSIAFNDYSYLYGSLLTLPIGWLLILFYYLVNSKIEFPHSRKGFNRTRTTMNYVGLFCFKAIIYCLPLIIVIILVSLNLYVINVYAIIACALVTPLSFFCFRFFLIKEESNKGGDEDN